MNVKSCLYYCFFHSDSPVEWNGTTLYFRGFKVLEVVIDAILAVGGDDIEDVILTGCSGTYKPLAIICV